MLPESEISNFLVSQKNMIIELIDAGRIEEARDWIAFLKPLWLAHGYGYKRDELLRRANAYLASLEV